MQDSNVDTRDLKEFRGYEARQHSKIERSCLSHESIELQVWAHRETALRLVNRILTDYLDLLDCAPRALLGRSSSILHSQGSDTRTVDFGRYVLLRFRKLIRRLETDPMPQTRLGCQT